VRLSSFGFLIWLEFWGFGALVRLGVDIGLGGIGK